MVYKSELIISFSFRSSVGYMSGTGQGGLMYGSQNLEHLYMGSGGGSGGNAADLSTNPWGNILRWLFMLEENDVFLHRFWLQVIIMPKMSHGHSQVLQFSKAVNWEVFMFCFILARVKTLDVLLFLLLCK